MPRNDNRSRAPDRFGKPGTSFPDNSLTTPKVIEEHTDKQERKPKKFLAAHDKVPSALLTGQQTTKGDNTDLVETQVFETIPSFPLVSKEMDPNAQGATTTRTTNKIDASTAAPSLDFKTLSWSDQRIDANLAQRTIVTLTDSAFPILTEYDQDEETLALITHTYQVVDASAVSAPSKVQGQITRYQKMDKWRSLKIVTTISKPSDYSEVESAAHNFYELLSSYTYTDACGASKIMRGAFSTYVACYVDHTFGSFTALPLLLLYQIIPNSFAISRFVVNQVLNDAATLTLTGACTDSIALNASIPSLTAYNAAIGTNVVMSYTSKIWKANWFKNSIISYTLV